MSNSSELFGGGSSPKKWVSGTTYQEGTVVWSPTDYQYFMRKTTGAGTTDPVTDTTNWQPTGDRAIKSIQRGSSSTGSVFNISISAVNIAKSNLYVVGANSNSGGTVTTTVGGVLTSSTNIALVNSGQSGGGNVAWEVVERY